MVIDTIKTLLPQSTRAKIGRSLRTFNRKPSASFGRDFIAEVKSRLPQLQVRTIFDVGAYVGSTALEYSDSFPEATVYAFEPDATNFKRQEVVLAGKPEVKRYQIGFGASEHTAKLFMDPQHPSMGRLVEGAVSNTATVVIDTMDHFCDTHGLTNIDILKIDTEGHEIPVLTGASRMLRAGTISVIKAEVAVDPDMHYHTSFVSLAEFLNPFGYRLFGLYDQCENEFSPGPRLRRFDACFVSGKMIQRHSAGAWIAAPIPQGVGDSLRHRDK
jgi:FkbM family methyltransferase